MFTEEYCLYAFFDYKNGNRRILKYGLNFIQPYNGHLRCNEWNSDKA